MIDIYMTYLIYYDTPTISVKSSSQMKNYLDFILLNLCISHYPVSVVIYYQFMETLVPK